MTYFIDTNDARNQILMSLLEERNQITEKFSFKTLEKIGLGDALIFSPAKKWTDEEINLLPNKISLYCGKISEKHQEIINNKEIAYHDLMNDEIFTTKNANITAEGLLALILEHSPKSIFENNVLIIGAGRIAKAMAIILGRLGVNYAVVRFNKDKFPECFSFSKTCYFGEQFLSHLHEYDVIINTIPKMIFDEQNFGKIARDTIYIETASTNSIDPALATHFEFVPAPALPQKYAKVTAAKYMLESITGENNYV